MTTGALLYQSTQRWRVGAAFGAAVLIHCAAIALASIHRIEKQDSVSFTDQFTEITFEAPSTPVDPNPDISDPLPTPPQIDETFRESTSTPPPIRRLTSRAIAPLVRPNNLRSPGPMTWSSAKVLAVSAPRPEYPYEARRQKITGDRIVAIAVDPVTGNVRDVSIRKSTGSPYLDNAALTGFRRWRFRPGTVSAVTCPITFTLTGASY
jgi:TonB family protein